VVLVLLEPLTAEAALPPGGVLIHVALEAAVGTETAPADLAVEGSVFTGHGFPLVSPGPVSALRLADYSRLRHGTRHT
jgi:hypothetical protein